MLATLLLVLLAIPASFLVFWEQLSLKKKLLLVNDFAWTLDVDQENSLKYIAGVDISFVKGTDDACAALVVLEYPSLSVVYEKYQMVQLKLPYIPGFLAFREVEFLVELLDELKSLQPELMPQLIFVDGNGYLHPRGFGLASHLGVLTDTPTVGCGKTLFYMDGIAGSSVKKNFQEKCKNAGDTLDLVGDSGTVWGAAFKSTSEATNPVFISQGHRIDLPTAIEACKRVCSFRVPEPIRLADLRSRQFLRDNYK